MGRIIAGVLAGIATLFFLSAVGFGWISLVVAVSAVLFSVVTIVTIGVVNKGSGISIAVTVIIDGLIVIGVFAISDTGVLLTSLLIGALLGIFWLAAIVSK